jgi:hypothetical protein
MPNFESNQSSSGHTHGRFDQIDTEDSIGIPENPGVFGVILYQPPWNSLNRWRLSGCAGSVRRDDIVRSRSYSNFAPASCPSPFRGDGSRNRGQVGNVRPASCS